MAASANWLTWCTVAPSSMSPASTAHRRRTPPLVGVVGRRRPVSVTPAAFGGFTTTPASVVTSIHAACSAYGTAILVPFSDRPTASSAGCSGRAAPGSSSAAVSTAPCHPGQVAVLLGVGRQIEQRQQPEPEGRQGGLIIPRRPISVSAVVISARPTRRRRAVPARRVRSRRRNQCLPGVLRFEHAVLPGTDPMTSATACWPSSR